MALLELSDRGNCRFYASSVPMHTDWDESTGLLIRVWNGRVDADEWQQVGPNVWSFPGMRRMLADISRWDRDPTIDAARIGAMAERLATAEGARSIRLAILATRQSLAAHEFATAFSKHRATASAVVSELDTACIWLGVDTESVRQRIEALLQAHT